jgi:hypothetical protein
MNDEKLYKGLLILSSILMLMAITATSIGIYKMISL